MKDTELKDDGAGHAPVFKLCPCDAKSFGIGAVDTLGADGGRVEKVFFATGTASILTGG
ncbi:MAG: hypothetical protein IH623_05345 [Verrucomicrobia bacterium]|nr:hypothetical protein [Verrucomicrobiota bacterium]